MGQENGTRQEEKIFEVWADFRVCFRIPVKAYNAEQAAQFIEKEFEIGGLPDLPYLYDDSLDSVDEAEVVAEGDEVETTSFSFDATDFKEK